VTLDSYKIIKANTQALKNKSIVAMTRFLHEGDIRFQVLASNTVKLQLCRALKFENGCFQYSKTKVMYVLFSSLKVKGLYMFRALLAHSQEVLHKWHLVYCVRVMSAGCTRVGVPVHYVGFTMLIYYDARSTKYQTAI
jgi:hypothetical protein